MNPKALRASSTRLGPAYIVWPTHLRKKVLDGQKIAPYLVTYPQCRRIGHLYATHILELIFVAMIAVVIATHVIPAII